MEKQFVIFELGGETFGINIADVESIIKMQTIAKVPHAPDFVEGVTNLRGVILPVIDLKKRFGLDATEITRETRIVVAAINNMKVGMIVEAVSEVLTIDDTAIEPTPPMVSSVDTAFIIGIAKLHASLVILLDLSMVLSVEEQQATALLPG